MNFLRHSIQFVYIIAALPWMKKLINSVLHMTLKFDSKAPITYSFYNFETKVFA